MKWIKLNKYLMDQSSKGCVPFLISENEQEVI